MQIFYVKHMLMMWIQVLATFHITKIKTVTLQHAITITMAIAEHAIVITMVSQAMLHTGILKFI